MAEQGKVELVRTGWSAGFSRNTSPFRLKAVLRAFAGTSTTPASSWPSEAGKATGGDETNLCHGKFGEFVFVAHAAAADFDAADINLLYFDGQPAAFAYNYRWTGALYGLRKGFDPRFAKLCPGLCCRS